jgi:excisionase family DNA binding protein
MCSGIAFLIGLVLLVKGDFRMFNRYVPRDKGRIIGLCLVAPLTFIVLYSFLFLRPSVASYSSWEDMLSDPALVQASCMELIILIAALGVAGYIIMALPKSPAPVTGGRAVAGPYSLAGAPSVLTPAEAAAYLRIPEFEVIALIEEGKLPAARIGGDYRIARIAVDDFLRSQGGL